MRSNTSQEEMMSNVDRSTPLDRLPQYLTIEEICHLLNIGRSLGYELVRSGELPAIRFVRLLYVPKSALLAHLERVR